ncbi:MAG: hypothetical protein QXK93_07880 [Candidatus Bathyarchaeia archaeon]
MKGDGTTPGWDTIQTDADGCFTYQYKLDGIEGLYEVRVYNSPWSGQLTETPLATATFTDTQQLEKLWGWDKKDGKWQTGDLAGWMEDDYANHRLEISNFGGGTLTFHINLDYTHGSVTGIDKGVQFYLGNGEGKQNDPQYATTIYIGPIVDRNNPLNINEAVTATSSYGSLTVKRLPNGLGKAGDSALRYEITVTTNLGHWFVYWESHLAIGSSRWSGSSLHIYTDEWGSKDVPISVPPRPANADVAIQKTGPSYAHVGDTITYTYKVTNNGPANATNVTVNDNKAGKATYVSGDTNNNNILEVGETWIFTASYTVLSTDPDPLNNTVTVTTETIDSNSTNNRDSWTVDILHPAIDVIKSANATIIHAGDWVKYNITVVNIGDCDLNVTLSDPLLSISWTGTLKPGEKHEEIASIKPTSDPTVNTASATGTDALGKTVTDFARCTVDIIKPAIDVAKTGPQTAYEGDTITYTITVTNTGDCALSNVSVVDSALGFKWNGSLAIGETKTFSIQYTIPEGSNEIVNTVFASGKDALGKMVTDYATWTVEVIIPPAQITEVECCCSVTDGNFKQIKVFTAVFTPTNSRRTEYKLTATKPNAFYYVIKITNTGTSDATPVVINFQLDQDFIIKGIDPIQVHTGYGRTGTRITASTTYNTNSGTITISNLNAGQTLYITISMDYKYKGQTFSKSEVYNWVKTHPSNTFNCTLTQPNTRTCSTTIIDPPTLNSPEKIPAIIILAILSLGTSLTLKIKQRKPKLQK